MRKPSENPRKESTSHEISRFLLIGLTLRSPGLNLEGVRKLVYNRRILKVTDCPRSGPDSPSDFRKFFGNILENSSKTHQQQNGRRFAFDEFEIDGPNRMLLRSGQEVPLTAKVFTSITTLACRICGK